MQLVCVYEAVEDGGSGCKHVPRSCSHAEAESSARDAPLFVDRHIRFQVLNHGQQACAVCRW